MDDRSNICDSANVQARQDGSEVVIRIIGDFDMSTTHLVRKCCEKIQKLEGVKKIIIDLEKAKRVDTSAFACIIEFTKGHLISGTEIFVTHLHDSQEKLIQLLKIEKLIKVI